MNAPNRAPAGTPTGGQFAAGAHAETDVSLSPAAAPAPTALEALRAYHADLSAELDEIAGRYANGSDYEREKAAEEMVDTSAEALPQVMAALRRFLDSNPSEPEGPEGPSALPISAQDLRDDWVDDPILSPEQVSALEELDDETLNTHLDLAFANQKDAWYQVLDETRSSATNTLLKQNAALRAGVLTEPQPQQWGDGRDWNDRAAPTVDGRPFVHPPAPNPDPDTRLRHSPF